MFHLIYCDSNQVKTKIGKVKILHIDNGETHQASEITEKHIPAKPFYHLNEKFVSLGQSLDYYLMMTKLFGVNEAKKYLYAINDCAIFPQNLETARSCPNYRSSLIRNDMANSALRLARMALIEPDSAKYFDFDVSFKAPYADEFTKIGFRFNSKLLFPRRVYCLIGKNGVGKTQLLSQLPQLIRKKGAISPFAKYLFISTCYSETFSEPKDVDMTTTYETCGLLDIRGKEFLIRSPTTLKKIISDNIAKIAQEAKENREDPDYADRVESLQSILKTIFDEELVSGLIDEDHIVNDDVVNNLCGHLSSGEFTLLYVVSSIVAKIRVGSLLLFDEPETHLHPNAVSQLISTIHSILERFDSYAVIATHSPIVIREVESNGVLMIRRFGNICKVQKILQQTLGGDLAELTREVFGTEDDQLYYKRKIIQLKKNRYTSEAIKSTLISYSKDGHLGLGLSFFIDNC